MKKPTLYLFSMLLINIIFTSCGDSTNKNDDSTNNIYPKDTTKLSLDDRYYDVLTEKEQDSISKRIEGKDNNLTNEELKIIKMFNKWKAQQNYISNEEKSRIMDSLAEVAINGKNMVRLIEGIIDDAEIELTRQKIKKIERKVLLDNVLKNVVGAWQIATDLEMPVEMKDKLKIRILKDQKFDELIEKFGEE
ncbi:MAG: hypothetical protein ACKO7P_13670 [Bacteroidota bacterium]